MSFSARLTARQGRKFAFTLGFALLVVAAVFVLRSHSIVPIVLSIPAVLLLIAGMFFPTRLGAVERRWMAFGRFLSRYSAPVMLGIVYFLVITPFGIGMRIFGKNPLTQHHTTSTTWVDRGNKSRSDLKRQF